MGKKNILRSGFFNADRVTLLTVTAVFAVMAVLVYTGNVGRQIQNMLTSVACYIVLAVSLNLVVGLLGELSLGHAGFMSVGLFTGCTVAVLLQGKLPAAVCLPLCMVIGGHGDTTMIPLLSKASVNGVPVTQFASKKKLEEAVASTMVGGATLTKLIGTSAWYAPGAAASMMVESILHDQKKIVPCCCYLEGEYGQNDICIGVPAVIGRKGIEKIVKLDLTKEEAAKFEASAAAVRKTNQVLHEIKAL